MLEAIRLFLVAIVSRWWGLWSLLLAGGLAESLVVFSPSVMARIDAFIPPDRRRHLWLLLALLIFIYSSFSVFREEYRQRVKAEGELKVAREALNKADGELSVLRQLTRSQGVTHHAPSISYPKPNLSRPLQTDSFNASLAGRDKDGKQAVSSTDLAFSSFARIMATVRNNGSDILSWHLVRWTATIDGKLVFKHGSTAKAVLTKDEKADLDFPVNPEVVIGGNTKPIKCRLMIEYDTIPASGRRLSTVVYEIGYRWIGPQPNNNTVPFPAVDLRIIDRSET